MLPTRRLLALVCATAALGGAALTAAPALAGGNAVINDCQSHGQLTHAYSVAQLRHAINVMPATVKQYTSCLDVLQQALVSARQHGGTAPAKGGGGGGSFLPTWLIVVLVVLILGAVTFGALALRRRRAPTGDAPEGPPTGDEPPEIDEPEPR